MTLKEAMQAKYKELPPAKYKTGTLSILNEFKEIYSAFILNPTETTSAMATGMLIALTCLGYRITQPDKYTVRISNEHYEQNFYFKVVDKDCASMV